MVRASSPRVADSNDRFDRDFVVHDQITTPDGNHKTWRSIKSHAQILAATLTPKRCAACHPQATDREIHGLIHPIRVIKPDAKLMRASFVITKR